MRKRNKNNSTLVAALFLLITSPAFLEHVVLYAQQAAPSKAVGTVAGKVRLEGRFSKPAPLKVNKNRHFCGNEVPNESLLVNLKGGLQNAVIMLRGGKSQGKESTLETLILDNKNCAFAPHVQVAPTGSELLLLNSDPILHDAHARLGPETLFNVGLPTWRRVKERLKREGIVKVECDVLHTWQSAYIVVTSSPYFAVTDEKGEFVIEGVPPGTYQMDVWHEKLGRQSRTIIVSENSTFRLDLVFPSDSKSFVPGKKEGRP